MTNTKITERKILGGGGGPVSGLISQSKQLHELVVSEHFIVEDVIGESTALSFTPLLERRIGGAPSESHTIHTSELTLKVMPKNKKVPIRTIRFNGSSIVQAGHHVIAEIPRYEEIEYTKEGFPSYIYLDRQYRETEEAIELKVFSSKAVCLRTDRSVNYKEYIKS